jgi:hypothetical protein
MPRFAIGQDVWVLYCLGKVCKAPLADIDQPDAFEIVGGTIVSYRSDKKSYEVKLNDTSMTPIYKEFEISASEDEANGRLKSYYDSLINAFSDMIKFIEQSKLRHCK